MTNRATTKCKQTELAFASCQGRKVTTDFGGGDISSEGGLVLLREVDRSLNLLSRAARQLDDHRQPGKITHSTESLFKQRVMALAQGYEDLNDHDQLRHDSLLQLAAGKIGPLASAPTLCRMEHRADKHSAMRLNKLLVELFIESFDAPPEELILDFDATDDPTHGRQEGVFFHGYYRHYCFLPLYVFCGSQPLVAWLRPSNIDGARGSWIILKMLAKRLREKWPEVRIIFRGDSGFCRHRMLDWCDSNDIGYVVGLARNNKVTYQMQFLLDRAAHQHALTGEKQREFTWLYYGASTWNTRRTVIGKAEHTDKGSNPRYLFAMLNTAIGRLRIISLIEGISYLYLLFHAIYSKRILGIEDAIRTPGMIHGVLFCIFCVALLDAKLAQKWSLKPPFWIFAASLVPIAPAWVEVWLKKQQPEQELQ